MGLFDRKRTSFDSVAPLYTVGNSKTLLVIGLGNPGQEYAGNRHNLGFMVLDKYHASHDFSGWVAKKDLGCELATGQIGSTRVLLAKPMTFMNNSGESAQKLQKFYRVYNQETVVVHDELDIDFGTIRTRIGGGSAGHNGIKSLTETLGEDYGRIRIGIGPVPYLDELGKSSESSEKHRRSFSSGDVSTDMPSSEKSYSVSSQNNSEKHTDSSRKSKHAKMDSADFVLQDFSVEQQELLPKLINEACSLLDEATTGVLPEHTVTIEK